MPALSLEFTRRIRPRSPTRCAVGVVAAAFVVAGIAPSLGRHDGTGREKAEAVGVLTTSDHREGPEGAVSVERGSRANPGGAPSRVGGAPIHHGVLAQCIAGLNC